MRTELLSELDKKQMRISEYMKRRWNMGTVLQPGKSIGKRGLKKSTEV